MAFCRPGTSVPGNVGRDMAWIERKPRILASLDGALESFRTADCRALAVGYQAMLAAAGGALPAKNGLDISVFTAALPSMVLCAVIPPDRCIYRLAGEATKTRMGLNPVGRNYYDFVPEARRAYAQQAMNMVVEGPSAFRAEIEQTYSGGLRRQIEVVALPLLSEEVGVKGFILFGDCQIDARFDDPPSEATLLDANVTRRDLIDLGHGVDPSFVDIVQIAPV